MLGLVVEQARYRVLLAGHHLADQEGQVRVFLVQDFGVERYFWDVVAIFESVLVLYASFITISTTITITIVVVDIILGGFGVCMFDLRTWFDIECVR